MTLTDMFQSKSFAVYPMKINGVYLSKPQFFIDGIEVSKDAWDRHFNITTKEVARDEVTDDILIQMLETERHHDHKIVRDESGVLRWATDDFVDKLVHVLDLNRIVMTLEGKGYDKNSELYRELYRRIGYSLSGYDEIFYWVPNNEKASEYKPPKS